MSLIYISLLFVSFPVKKKGKQAMKGDYNTTIRIAVLTLSNVNQ